MAEHGIARPPLGDLLCMALPGLVAFGVYWMTLAPTVTGEDAGELILAAWSLGIPHPPGYPLWTLLAHPFTWLPVGDVAFRVNLASATFGALAVSLLAALGLRLHGHRVAAAGAALIFAFSLSFWRQALFAEVYSLNALCFGGCLYCILAWEDTRRKSWLLALATLYGLSLGAHNTMMVVGPVFAFYILLRDDARRRNAGLYGACIGIAVLATGLIYLYLPIRAAADPIMNWGDPATLGAFWETIARTQYAHMFTEGPRSLSRYAEQLVYMAQLWGREFTVWGGVAALAGFICFLRTHHALAILTLVLALTVIGTATYVQNFEFDVEWLWVMMVFGIPAYFVTALWMGSLLAALRPLPGAAILLTALLVGLNINAHWSLNDKSDYYWAADYAENLLEALPEDAVLIAHQDHANFPALYRQAVEGLRKDVVILRKYGYLALEQLPEMDSEARAQFSIKPRVHEERDIVRWILEHTERPVFVSSVSLRPDASYRAVPAGLVHQILRPGESMALEDPLRAYRWRSGDPRLPHPDYTVRLMGYELHRAEAEIHFAEGDLARALEKVHDALGRFGEDPIILNSLGILCARNGLYEEADELFDRALALRPHFEAARNNQARLPQ